MLSVVVNGTILNIESKYRGHPPTASDTTSSFARKTSREAPSQDIIDATKINASPERLQELSLSTNYVVRCHVAENPNTLPQTLLYLAHYPGSYVVLQKLAGNPNTPLEALVKIAEGAETVTLLRLVANPSTSPEILSFLARTNRTGKVLLSVAKDPRTPVEALDFLSTHKSPFIQKAVSDNPKASWQAKIRIKLGQDVVVAIGSDK